MNAPTHIQKAFAAWLLNQGYKCKKCPLSIQFIKHKRPMCELDYMGNANKPMRKMWINFCNAWLNNGREFVEGLQNGKS